MAATCNRTRPRTAAKTISTVGPRGAGGAGANLADGWLGLLLEDEALRLEVAVDLRFIRAAPGLRRIEQHIGDQAHQKPNEHQIPSQCRARGRFPNHYSRSPVCQVDVAHGTFC